MARIYRLKVKAYTDIIINRPFNYYMTPPRHCITGRFIKLDIELYWLGLKRVDK